MANQFNRKQHMRQPNLTKVYTINTAVIGLMLGVIMYYAIPGYIEASNVFMAIMVGAASGLSATGTNQIIKQLKPKSKEEDEDGETK